MLTVKGVPELRAAVLLFQRADAETRKALQKESRSWAPDLQRAVQARARGSVDRRIAASGKTSITANGLKATFGASGRLPSGEALREVARPYEFGSDRRQAKVKYLSRQRLTGKAITVVRRTKVQLPAGSAKGRFVYQGLADATPELVGRYVRAIARAVTRG